MDFAQFPPEINSALMYAGPGSGPMLAAAAAWEALAGELQSTASSWLTVLTGLTDGPWQGPSSAAMAGAVTPQIDWLSNAAEAAQQTGSQAAAAASIGSDPGPAYISAELISGGNCAKSTSLSPQLSRCQRRWRSLWPHTSPH